MTAILKVDTIQDTSGNNIINEASDVITIGASGDTIALAGTTVTGITQGITMADQWRLSGNITSDSNPITSNLEQVDTSGQGTLGTGMTESSGVFTFPSTGIYKVEFIGYASANGSDNILFAIMCTTNNSSYVEIARNFYGVGQSQLGTAYCSSLVDVTDISNVKVSFQVGSLDAGSYAGGDTAKNQTTMTFIRLGDT